MRVKRDVALCAIADAQVKSKVMNAMIKQRIPYAEEWNKVPLLQRKRFEGMKEVCVVITHEDKEEEAKKLIDSLGDEIADRVQFNLKGIL